MSSLFNYLAELILHFTVELQEYVALSNDEVDSGKVVAYLYAKIVDVDLDDEIDVASNYAECL